MRINEIKLKAEPKVEIKSLENLLEKDGTGKILPKIKKPKKVKLSKKQELELLPKREIVVSTAIIRPTGLLDPIILIRPVKSQVDDILEEVRLRVISRQRVLITALTKKFAEELDLYFKEIGVKSAYIHSEVQAMERVEILGDLRRGKYDVLIGINLLREGLDLPEVSLVAIFDADKEGFLRSKTSLIQIIGRAARHEEGTVIMYADRLTGSMKEAILETENRRRIQTQYNQKNGIIPKSTVRHLADLGENLQIELENNQNFGQSGASLTQFGFEKKEESSKINSNKKSKNSSKNGNGNTENEKSGENSNDWQNSEIQEMSFQSDFSRKARPKNKARAVQVFDTFESEKEVWKTKIWQEVKNKKLELKTSEKDQVKNKIILVKKSERNPEQLLEKVPNPNSKNISNKEITKYLEKELKIAVKNYEFEKAAALKEILETF